MYVERQECTSLSCWYLPCSWHCFHWKQSELLLFDSPVQVSATHLLCILESGQLCVGTSIADCSKQATAAAVLAASESVIDVGCMLVG